MENAHAGEKHPIPNAAISKTPRLLLLSELPDWYQRNDFILSGYRSPSYSIAESILSVTYVHNETANIFSHLLPAAFTLGAQLWLWDQFWTTFPNADYREYSIFAINLLAATICFGVSAVYHAVINHSPYILDLSTRIDYVGILCMIVGNFITGVYVAFYCQPMLQKTYWTMVSGYCVSFVLRVDGLEV